MANGRKYTTYFNADSSGFKKGTDEAVQALQKMNKELVNNQYRQKDCNKAISDAQKELKKTAQEIEKLEKEQKEKGKLDEKDKKQLDDLKAKHKQLGETIESEKVKLAQLRTEQAGIKGTISDLSKEIAGNNKEWTTLKATIANLASDSLELLARKLLEIGKAVISTGEQFTASMSEVGAISGASAEQLELLEQTAREYGATTKFSASESAQALKYMALAGWDTQQSIEALGSVLDLAAAGNMDLARASDIVTDYLTAFGLAAEDSAHFADVMAYAMANSNTNVEQLGEAYKNCAASAASMGYSVEEVTAVLMTMANAGVKGGEAGTTLNTIMTRLATDTKGCASALKEIDDSLDIFDDNGNLKSLSEILDIVTKAFDGMNDAQKAALSKVIAGQNQYTGFQTILKGLSEKAKETGQSFGDYSKALEECDGTSKGMAKTMSDNLSGDIKTMQSAFEELALKIYDSGETPLRDLVKFVTNSVVPGLETLINHMNIIVPIFVAAASAVGAYKAALGIQSIINGITQATAALTAAKGAEKIATDEATASQAALNTVQAANPIGLVVSAIAMLVAGLTTYSLIAGQSAESTDDFTRSLKEADKAIEEYNSSLDNAKEKYQNTIASAESDSAVIRSLSKEYEKLCANQNRTAAETTILNHLAEELAQSMGKSVDDLKDQNGEYIKLNDTIEEYIKKLKEKARIEATTELYGDAVKARVKAQQELDRFLIENKSFVDKENRKRIEDIRDAMAHGATGITYDDEQEVNRLKAFDEKYNQLSETLKKATDIENTYSEAVDKAVESQEEASESTDVFSQYTDRFKKDQEEANKLLEKKTKTTKTAVTVQKDFNKTLKELQTTFNNDTNNLKSLADQYNSVANGQMMSLDALIQLSLQYPQYSSEILAANGSLEAQKNILNKLFEAKKDDLKATIEKMKAEKESMEAEKDYLINYINSLEALKKSINVDSQVTEKLKSLKERFEEINSELSNTPDKIKAFENAFESLQNIGINNYGKNSNTDNNYTPSQSISPQSSEWTWSWLDEQATGSSSSQARTELVERVHSLGKINDRELKAEYEKILREEQLTADESYNIRLKLYNMTSSLAQKEEDENKKRIQKRLDYAKAAYEKIVKGEVEYYQKESDSIKSDLDKKLKEIDEEKKQRQQKEEDEQRQKELKEINDELFYNSRRMTEVEKQSLLRRKQDIINDQANAEYERNIELRKSKLQEEANTKINKNTEAIERLNKSIESAAYYLAKMNGTATASQIVNNSDNRTSYNYISSGFGKSYDELIREFTGMIY